MNRQTLINRLVARKLASKSESKKPICVCIAAGSPNQGKAN